MRTKIATIAVLASLLALAAMGPAIAGADLAVSQRPRVDAGTRRAGGGSRRPAARLRQRRSTTTETA